MTTTAEEVIRLLPKILEENPNIRYEIYDILEKKFVTKEEIKEILQEMKTSREESNKKFEEMKVNSDKKFEEMMAESAKRFAESDEKFEEMMAESAKRFAESAEKFEEMGIESDKKFDAVHKEIMGVRVSVEEVKQRSEDFSNLIETVVGRLQTRAGKNLENTIAGALRYALDRKDIKPESIKLRQKIVDREGIIGRKGREHEFDIFASNGSFIIFEVKSTPEEEDVETFSDKCGIVIKELGLDKNKVEKVLITLQKDENIKKACKKHGVLLPQK